VSVPLPILSCSLGTEGLRAQAARYARLGGWVEAFARTAEGFSVRFAPELDTALLEEALAVERGCCAFFRLDWEPAARELRAGVASPADRPALDALAGALGLPA
jgi:hypothetical protein